MVSWAAETHGAPPRAGARRAPSLCSAPRSASRALGSCSWASLRECLSAPQSSERGPELRVSESALSGQDFGRTPVPQRLRLGTLSLIGASSRRSAPLESRASSRPESLRRPLLGAERFMNEPYSGLRTTRRRTLADILSATPLEVAPKPFAPSSAWRASRDPDQMPPGRANASSMCSDCVPPLGCCACRFAIARHGVVALGGLGSSGLRPAMPKSTGQCVNSSPSPT